MPKVHTGMLSVSMLHLGDSVNAVFVLFLMLFKEKTIHFSPHLPDSRWLLAILAN